MKHEPNNWAEGRSTRTRRRVATPVSLRHLNGDLQILPANKRVSWTEVSELSMMLERDYR